MTASDPIADILTFFDDDDHNIAFNRAWFGIMRAHRRLLPRLTKTLKKHGVNDPIWFEILLEVDRSGPEGQPMAALEEKLSIPQYALSRHVARLEKEGFVRREFITDGRRKQILFLTREGTGLHEKIWPIYAEAMQQELAPFMSTDEAYALSWLLLKLNR
ncbi:MarR family winged helix-turn-helix transcriptional regulator [Thalassobius sp. Cn5-15]|uniref:MarR family winged helix-turn-helix transcriptional regulator n=1 Tax=Thalassobius sp. Cn5-15 TaxID=2917763 RepID=UPI001EF182DC|nr:MarR family transcriptional regulator [Thalassobius sp. Cn5-15]MCG7494227.1 MarR family transcriptional regulator [Thalassobius sp. Cn5-15]